MLLALPVETITYIIQLAAPLSYSPASHSLRCYTLRQCCLTSSWMKEIAPPLLHEVYFVDGLDAAATLLPLEEGGRGFGEEVKVLVMKDWEPSAPLLAGGSEWTMAELCPNVTDLRIFTDEFVLYLSVAELAEFTRLTCLALHSVKLRSVAPHPLPHLAHLSLSKVRARQDVLHDLLHATTLPSLESLFLDDIRLPNHSLFEMASDLPPQLSLVTQPLNLWAPLASIYEDERLVVLGDTDSLAKFRNDRLVPPRHLRLTFSELHSFDPSSPFYLQARSASLSDDLSLLARFLYRELPERPILDAPPAKKYTNPMLSAHLAQLEAARPDFDILRAVPLETLHLPRTLHPLTPNLDPLIAPLRDEVVELCERESVKVFWYDPALCEEGNRWASEGFAEWAKEKMKRRRGKEGKEEEARGRQSS